MTLLQQFDDQLKDYPLAAIRALANKILIEGLNIFRDTVPIDTQQLKMSISGEVHETKKGFEIRIYVKNVDLTYDNNRINAVVLGLILERGRGKGGVMLRRTQPQPHASEGSPTAKWFDQATERWNSYAANELRA